MQINHRAEAEKHLGTAAHHLTEDPGDMRIAEATAAIALVHATLARDEEQDARTADMRDALTLLRRHENAMRDLISTHIAQGLASREKNRWKAAIDLSKALDEGDCNVDDLVDARLEDDGWDPRSAYKTPASLVPSDDPWTPAPDITADVPEPVRRVLAGHLAEALIDGDNTAVRNWARGIAYELKREGADLTDAIKERISDLTLGADPSNPPF